MDTISKTTHLHASVLTRISLAIVVFVTIQMAACNSKEKEVIVTPAQSQLLKRENVSAKDIFSPDFNILFLRNYNTRPDSNQLKCF